MQIQDKIIPDQKIAVINYKGPISDLEILLSKLMGWVETDEVETIGEPFVIYYSPRHKINEGDAVFDVGIPIKNDAPAKDIIKTADLFEHGVLSGIHKGSADNILDSYDTMVKVAQENNYDIIGSPTEILVKNIHNADNEKEYITEIQLPIIKM